MAGAPPPLEINPPLVNSASPWATTLDDLRRLYACPSTGAVTTRTSLINGFDHDPAKHQHAFFDATLTGSTQNASLNSLGYSPLTLDTYLGFIKTISDEQPARSSKGFIVSVTGTPEDIATSYKLIVSASQGVQLPLAMEINLSCPNIPNQPPPAYSEEALTTYLTHLGQAIAETADQDNNNNNNTPRRIPVGLKTPPYTYTTQYLALISALKKTADPSGMYPIISFITATNTLGSCLLFTPPPPPPENQTSTQPSPPTPTPTSFALPDPGIGGMAGAPLHPLALGNVRTIRRLLDEDEDECARGGRGGLLLSLGRHVRVVGVGGVLDAAGYRRMRAAGADVVGVATGLGVRGVEVFGEIEAGLGGARW
ncbi:hypothetical protein C8A00DRAFT_28524 [Chaetomidium leptoderma]|uniref:Dihydroorotate dehydrogenase (fumarate) n=1 Tax=Chaetomidium leptoderma TaxID=669021 RepID=A0AAN7A224_9PEZI|nr:hypothetical protein C8A00DRAFT_28524 [Chaetomidium leptoderma]